MKIEEIKEQRLGMRREMVRAETFGELTDIAKRHGYSLPENWANRVMDARATLEHLKRLIHG